MSAVSKEWPLVGSLTDLLRNPPDNVDAACTNDTVTSPGLGEDGALSARRRSSSAEWVCSGYKANPMLTVSEIGVSFSLAAVE